MRKVSNVKDRIKITTREEGIREKKKPVCREQRKTSNECCNLHLQKGDTRTWCHFLKGHISMIKIRRFLK